MTNASGRWPLAQRRRQAMADDIGHSIVFPNRGLSLRVLPRTTSKLTTQAAVAADDARVGFQEIAGLAAGLAAAASLALWLVWYFQLSQPVTCQPSPLIFHVGSAVDTDMTLRAGTRCPVYVLPGHATLDEPAIAQAPRHGSVTPRGHVGVYYRPEPGFRGNDAFAVTLNGKTAQKAGAMTIR